MAGEGWALRQQMIDAGMPEPQVDEYTNGLKRQMFESGLPPKDLQEYWMPRGPDKTALEAPIRAGLNAVPADQQAKVANTPWENVLAGLQMSASSLQYQKPGMVRAEGDIGITNSFLYSGGMMIGDLPHMIAGGVAGFFGGAATGTAVGGPIGGTVGGLAGSGAGAMGVPEAVRQAMLKYYQRSDPNAPAPTWRDFMNDAVDISMNTGKAMLIGAVGGLAGGAAGAGVLRAGGSIVGAEMANLTAQTVTQPLADAALTGHMPSSEDFIAGALLALATHGAVKTGEKVHNRFVASDPARDLANNMRQIYEETGIMPWEVAQIAAQHPEMMKELLAPNNALGERVTPVLDERRMPEPPPANPLRIVITADDLKPKGEGETAQGTPIDTYAAPAYAGEVNNIASPRITPEMATSYGFEPQRIASDPGYAEQAQRTIIADLNQKFGNTTDLLVSLAHSPEFTKSWIEGGRDLNDLPVRTQNLLAKAESEGMISHGINDALERRALRMQGVDDSWDVDPVPPGGAITEAEAHRHFGDWGTLVHGTKEFAHRIVRLPNGKTQVVPAPEAVVTYLQKIGKKAGFKFILAPQMEGPHDGMGPYMAPLVYASIVAGRDTKRVYKGYVVIPDNVDALARRWWGNGVSEIIFHEVGHALDVHFNKDKNVSSVIDPSLLAEVTAASKQFRPKMWEQAGHHVLKPEELLADAFATYLSNPTMREKMPLFRAKYGKELDEFVKFADSSLPVLKGETPEGKKQWGPPKGELAERPAEDTGGGGGKKPPPGKDVPSDMPPEENVRNPPHQRKITDEGVRLNTETLNALLNDWRAPEVNLSIRQRIVNAAQAWSRSFEGILTGAARRVDRLTGLKKDWIGTEDMLRQTLASEARAHEAWFYNQIDPVTLKPIKDSPTIRQAIQAIKEDGGNLNDFFNFRIAGRAIEKERQGIDIGSPLTTAQHEQIIRDGAKKYQRASDIWTEAQNYKVDYARDSGLFSKAGAEAMKDLNQAHIVLARVMNPDYKVPVGRTFSVRQPTKRLEGSERQLRPDQLTTERENLSMFYAMADRNRARLALVEQVRRKIIDLGHPDPFTLLEDWTQKPKALLEHPDFKKALDGELYDENGDLIPNTPQRKEAMLPLMVERKWGGGLGRDEFIVYKDGMPQKWKANNEDIAALMQMTWLEKLHPIPQFGAQMAHLMRTGIVSDFAFTLRTLSYGQLSQAVFTDKGARAFPYVDLYRGIMGLMDPKLADKLREASAMGVFGSALGDMEAKYIKRDVQKIFDETGTWSAVWNTVKNPIEMMQAFNQLVHQAASFGRYIRQTEAGVNEFKAAMETRTAYLDHAEPFAHNFVQGWSRLVPFMASGFKDLGQMAQAMKDRPMSTIAIGTSLIALPTILNAAFNYWYDQHLPENEKYANLPQWQRDGYWVTPPINGTRLRMPKGYGGTSLFSVPFERFAEWAFNPENGASAKEAKSLMMEMIGRLMPPLTPVGAVGWIEGWSGQDTMTGRSLVPAHLEKASGYMQYTPYTTEAAKGLARALGPPGLNLWENASPILIENMVKETIGTMPMAVYKWLEVPFKEPGRPGEIADTPFVGSFFVRNPDKSAQPIQDFYDNVHKLYQKRQDLRIAIERSDMREIKEATNPQAVVRLSEMTKAMSQMSAMVDAIYRSKTIDNDAKRQQTDELINRMIGAARHGSKVVKFLENPGQIQP